MPTPYALSSDLVSAWPAKSLEVATYLDTALASKSDTAPAINPQTGTTYTFVLADATAGKTITASNAAASTYTVPPQSSVTFVAGALLRVTNLGAGVVTFAGGVGVTVTNTAGTLAQYQTATLVRTGSDAWTVIKMGGASGLNPVTNGVASPSAAASIIMNNVFSADAENYLVVARLTLSGSGAALNVRLRKSGTDATGSNYAYQQIYASAATISAADATADTLVLSGSGGTLYWGFFYVYRPFVAATTTHITTNFSNTSSVIQRWCNHTVSDSYDGMTIYPDAGTTATGTVRVYPLGN